MTITKEMQQTIDRLHEQDHEHRVYVMTPDQAKAFVAEVSEGNGEELTDVDVFGAPIPENGLVIDALHPNGERKTFIFNANDRFSHLHIEVADAFEYAYDYALNMED